MKLNKVLMACMLFVGMSTQANATTTLTTFEHGEVFDGGIANPPDGIGDIVIQVTSSYFKQSGFSSSTEGQAMAFFHIPIFNNVTSAIFEWDILATQGAGAPDKTKIYIMLNDSSLSTDDFGKGILLGEQDTAGFTMGDTISTDITSILQGFTGDLGIRLESTAPFINEANAKFVRMAENGNARITVVPVPATIWLFGSGLLGFIGLRKRNSVVSV